jgi:hypothetical protein
MNIGKGWGLAAAVLLVGSVPVIGQYIPYRDSSGADIQPFVMMCAQEEGRKAIPCGGGKFPMTVLTTPFSFSNGGDPIVFDGITTTPKQFVVDKPDSATSYRILNPCNVDIRARRVANLTQQVTPTTGVRIMARSAETFGTSSPGFVSIMAVATPSAECNLDLNYGNGG